MSRTSREPCAWCGLESDRDLLVEPEVIRRTAKGETVIAQAITAPACELCAPRLAKMTPQRRAAVAGAWSRYWQRRQQTLV